MKTFLNLTTLVFTIALTQLLNLGAESGDVLSNPMILLIATISIHFFLELKATKNPLYFAATIIGTIIVGWTVVSTVDTTIIYVIITLVSLLKWAIVNVNLIIKNKVTLTSYTREDLYNNIKELEE